MLRGANLFIALPKTNSFLSASFTKNHITEANTTVLDQNSLSMKWSRDKENVERKEFVKVKERNGRVCYLVFRRLTVAELAKCGVLVVSDENERQTSINILICVYSTLNRNQSINWLYITATSINTDRPIKLLFSKCQQVTTTRRDLIKTWLTNLTRLMAKKKVPIFQRNIYIRHIYKNINNYIYKKL